MRVLKVEKIQLIKLLPLNIYPTASEASREVENFDWRKKHTLTRILCQNFVRLSVTNFDPNYLRTGRIEWAEKKPEIFYLIETRLYSARNSN